MPGRSTSRELTPSEAGFVLGRSPTSINKAVDKGLIQAKFVRRGSSRGRVLGSAELRFLKLAAALDRDLTASGRRKIYTALKGARIDTTELKLGAMRLDLRSVDQDLKVRLQRLDAIRSGVDGHGSREPALRGTDVPVHVLAALARDQSIDEIRADYPNLTRQQIETAIEYARAYPKRGRPYPTRSLKRALADLELHTIPIERTSGGPRRIAP